MNDKKRHITLSSKLDYENPFMQVYKEEVQRPNGKILPYWTIQRGDFPVIIPLFSDNMTLLVGQFRVPVDFYSWEFPMGFAKDVSVEMMAKQELQEETGYTASSWKEIGWYFSATGSSKTKVHVFVASDLHEGIASPEESEFIKIQKISIDEVKKQILDGTIKDGHTMTSFLFLENYLKNN